jgi:hypothetical protein
VPEKTRQQAVGELGSVLSLPALKGLDDALHALDGRRRTIGELAEYRRRTAETDDIIRSLIDAPVRRGPLPKRHKEAEEALVSGMSSAWKGQAGNAVPREDFGKVCETVARQLARMLPPAKAADRGLAESLGSYLLAESNLLREIGFNADQTASAVKKLSLYEIDDLSRNYPKTMANWALEAKNPSEAAAAYKANYSGVEAEAGKTHPDIAKSVAASTFYLKDPLGAAARFTGHYDDVVKHLKGEDPNIAKSIAGVAFKLKDPLKAADGYAGNYHAIVKRMSAGVLAEEPDPKSAEEIARTIASAAFTAEDSEAASDRLLGKYRSVVAHLTATRPDIARTVARTAFTAADEKAAADEYVRAFDRVVAHLAGTRPDLAKTIASRSFMAQDPLKAADKELSEY